MCVGIACKIPDPNNDGEMMWVIGKNRDRNYIPKISFKLRSKGSTEYRTFIDNDTFWSEGVNSNGIAIVNTALMVVDDEKAGKKGQKGKSPSISHDGDIIKKALRRKDIMKAVEEIVKGDVFGFTFITNGKELYLVENVREYDNEEIKEEIEYKKRKSDDDLDDDDDIEIKKQRNVIAQKMNWYKVEDEDWLVRTNHGEIFSDIGYKMGTEDGESSRHRRKYVEEAIKKIKPKTVKEVLDCLCNCPDKNPQYNPIRERKKGCELFTTGQYVMSPLSKTLYYKPLDCELYVNDKKIKPEFLEFNNDKTKTNIFVITDSEQINESKSFDDYLSDKIILV